MPTPEPEVRLSIAIQAVPARREYVARLAERLIVQVEAARARGLRVYGPHVSVDAALAGPWAGWRAAWQTHRLWQVTHHVVLQDDVQVCADFPETMAALARARPDDPVSGFIPRNGVTTALAAGLRWARARNWLWAQCLMLPALFGDQALAWIAREEGQHAGWHRSADARLGSFFRARRAPVYVAVPHPVEHIADQIGGSTLGHNFTLGGRVARRRGDDEARREGVGGVRVRGRGAA